MTISGDTVCKLIQSFPILLILAQNNNKCLDTPLIYKPPTPTQSPEYYEALDALFHTLYSKPDCQNNNGKPHYVYTNPKPYGYPNYGYSHYKYGYTQNYPCEYTHKGNGYNYKNYNLYNSNGKFGGTGYAPNNHVYVNKNQFKMVLRTNKFGKNRSQKIQENSCNINGEEIGKCVNIRECTDFNGNFPDSTEQAVAKDDQCPTKDNLIMVCCPIDEEVIDRDVEILQESGINDVTKNENTSQEKVFENEFSDPILNSDAKSIETTDEVKTLKERIEDYYIDELPRPPSCGINNGSAATNLLKGPVPWLTLLGYMKDTKILWLCGGSLISNRHVLTAAHCIYGHEDMLFLVRFTNGLDSNNDNYKEVPIALKIVHKDFNDKTKSNNIGLLTTAYPIIYSEFIRPICLPLERALRRMRFQKFRAYVVNWEAMDKSNVSQIHISQVSIMSSSKCGIYGRSLDRRVICAGVDRGGEELCTRDGGSPLQLPIASSKTFVLSYYQIGFVSYGKSCASNGFPGVYTRVGQFMPWILEMATGKNSS